MIRSSNPILSDRAFEQEHALSSGKSMTIQGTVNKTALLLLLTIGAASWTWTAFLSGSNVLGLSVIGAIVGFILALVISFKRHLAPTLTPLYAICQGLFLGAISAMFESQYPGLVIQAVGLTFSTLFCLLGAYKTGLIKVTENFKMGVMAATGGIMVFYLVAFVLSIFGFNLNAVYGNGILGIFFSLFVVGIAALNLVMDFDFIEKASQSNSPQYMEWYGAFGLLVTLIWLYVEILRLLAKLRSRD